MGIIKTNIINIKESTKIKKKVRFRDQEIKNKVYFISILLVLFLSFFIYQGFIQCPQINNYILYILTGLNRLVTKLKGLIG